MTEPSVAVTGASGYIGSRLLAELGPAGRALVRKQVPYLPADRQVPIDLLSNGSELIDALAGIGTVVHLAGQNELVAAQEPDRALSETLIATRRVAAAAAEAGVRRIVYVSTIHVYGAGLVDDAVVDESMVPRPTSTYAIARLACEHLVGQTAADGADVVVIRLSNAVGAPVDAGVDRWSLVATDLCRQAATSGRMQLRSSGMQYRDFVALSDVSRIIARCADGDGVPAGTYNLASGRPMTVRGLAELIQDAFERRTGVRPPLDAPDPTGPSPRPYRVVTDHLDGAAGHADTPLTDAVDELVAFCLDNEARL